MCTGQPPEFRGYYDEIVAHRRLVHVHPPHCPQTLLQRGNLSHTALAETSRRNGTLDLRSTLLPLRNVSVNAENDARWQGSDGSLIDAIWQVRSIAAKGQTFTSCQVLLSLREASRQEHKLVGLKPRSRSRKPLRR